VFRDQSITNQLDFDGVTKDGFDRSHSPWVKLKLS
jgi:hypothetical protein